MDRSVSHSRVTVTELRHFLTKPPPGFSVKTFQSGYRVHSDPDLSLVLIDDLELSWGKVVFQTSKGRKVKMHDLWEYTSMRKSLLSRKIYLLVSAHEDTSLKESRALGNFVVSIDGGDPFVKWQLEKCLDSAISSVAGESYRVEIDLSDAMKTWAGKNLHIITGGLTNVKPVWRDASFTLKYYSDALFDFPHWFGFSRRKFNLRLT